MVSASPTGARPTSVRRRLANGSALAAVLVLGGAPAFGADIPQGGVVVNLPGGGAEDVRIGLNGGALAAASPTITVPGATTALAIEVQQAKTVINWTEFNIGTGNSVAFSRSGAGNYAVLNRVTGPFAPSTIGGTLSSTAAGQIWVLNRAGLIFTGTARIDTGSFVASALEITDANFGLAGGGGDSFTFTRATDLDPDVQAALDAARISLAAPGAADRGLFAAGPILLVAPDIATAGRITAGGDVGLVLASAATVELSTNSLLGITIDAGTRLTANALDVMAGSTTSGDHVYGVAASRVDPVAALLRVEGAITATDVTATENGIVLSAGADVGTLVGVPAADNAAVDIAIGGAAVLTDDTSSGGILVSANRDVAIGGTAAFAGAPLFVTAGRDIALTGATSFATAAEFTATRDVRIDTLTGTTAFDDDVSFSGRDIVFATGTESLTFGGNVDLDATRDVTVTTTSFLAGAGDLDISAGDDIRVTTTTGAIGIRNATTAGTGDTESDGSSDIVLDAFTAATLVNGDARRDIALTAVTTATLADAVANRDITLTAATASLDDGLAGRDITLTGTGAAGAIRAEVTTRARAGDDVRVTATLGSVDVADTEASGNTLNGARTGFDAGVATDTETDGFNVALTAAEDVTLAGFPADGNLVITARDIAITAAVLGLTGGNTVTLTADDDIRINATGGDARLLSVTTLGTAGADNEGDGSNILVRASGDVAIGTAVSAGDLTLLGDNVRLDDGTVADDIALVASNGNATLGNARTTGLFDSEAGDDTLALLDLAAAPVANPSGRGGTGNLTRLAGSNIVVAASGDVVALAASTVRATRDARFAGDAVGVGDVRAGRDAFAIGDSVTGVRIQGGDDATAIATGGAADITTVRASGVRLDTATGLDLATAALDSEASDASTLVGLTTGSSMDDPTRLPGNALSRLAGSNALVIADGSARAATATAARDLRVVARRSVGGTATLDDGTAGRDLLLYGFTIASATQLTAGDDVAVVATTNGAVRSLTSTGLGTDTEGSDATALADATGTAIANPALNGGAGSIVRLAGSNVTVAVGGSLTGNPAGTIRGFDNVRLGAGAALGFGDAQAGRDLIALGASVDAARAAAGDDAIVAATAGSATVGTLAATGLRLDGVTAAGDNEASDLAIVPGIVFGATINDASKLLAPALTGFVGANAVATASTTTTVTTATAARDLRVVAGTAATLTTGTAGRDLLLLGNTSATSTGALTAGDDIAVVARAGTASVRSATASGAGADSEADDTVVLADASGGSIANPAIIAGLGNLDRLAGANVVVAASGNVATTAGGLVRARRDARFAGNGSVAIGDVRAGRDAIAVGTSVIGTRVQGGDDAIVIATAGNADVGTVRASGLGLNTATGADLGATVDTEAGDDSATITGLTAGSSFDDPTKLPGTPLANVSGSTALVIASGSATATTGAAVRDLRVVAGTAARLDDGTAGRDILVLGNSANSATQLTAGDDVTLVARTGDASFRSASATGAVDSELGNDFITLTDATNGVIANPATIAGTGDLARLAGSNIVVAAAGDITAVSGGVIRGARDVRFAANGSVEFGAASAGRDMLAVGTAVTAVRAQGGDDATVIATAGNADVGAIVATGFGLDVATGADLAIPAQDSEFGFDFFAVAGLTAGSTLDDPTKAPGTPLANLAGSSAIVIASGSAGADVGNAVRDLRVVAGTAATLDDGTAGRDILVLGNSANSAVQLTAGDDVTLVARAGDASFRSATATGTAADNEFGNDSITLTDATNGVVANPATGTGVGSIARLAGSNIVVAASGNIAAVAGGVIRGSRDVRFAGGGAVNFGEASAGRDILAIGSSVTAVRAQGGDDAIVIARTGAADIGTIAATGRGLDTATGANLASAAQDSEAGSDLAAVAGLTFGSTIDDPSQAPGTPLTGFATSNALVVAATAADVDTGTVTGAAATRNLRVTAGTSATLGNGTATNAVTVLAGTAATLGEGAATLGNITVTGTSASAGTTGLADAGIDVLVTGTATTATIGTATATRDIVLAAGTAAALGTGLAGRDITLTGMTVTATSARAGDDVRATATAGNATIGTAEATGRALNIARTDFGATAAASSEGVAASDIVVRATGGNATVTTARALTDLFVEASGAASLATGIAGRDLLLLGDSATSATFLEAGDDIAVVADDSRDPGTARGNATVAVAAATGRALTYAGGFVRSATPGSAVDTEADDTAPLLDAAGAPVADPRPTPGDLAGLAGANLLVVGSGNASLTSATASTAARDIRVLAAAAALITNADAGRNLILEAGTTATLVNGTAGGFISLGGGGDVILTDNIIATGAVNLQSLAGLIDASAIEIEGSSITLQAFTDATLGKATAFAGDIIVRAGNDITLTDVVSATGNVDLLATTGSITATASTVTGANIILAAGTDATLADATATLDITMLAGGAATLGAGVAGRDITVIGATADVTTATADDDVVVIATGGDANVATLTATGALDSEAGDDSVLLLDATGATVANPVSLAGAGDIARLGGGNIVVAAAGNVISTAGTTFAATDVRFAGTGSVAFTTARAGRDLLAIGAGVTGTTAQAGDDVALVATTGALAVTDLVTTGLGLDAVTGANLATAAFDNDATDAAGFGGLVFGTTIADPTSGLALTRLAGFNAIAIGTGDVTVTTGAAARDLRIVAGNDAAVTGGTAGRDLLLLGGRNATATADLLAGDDITVIAGTGTATIQAALTAGGSDSEGGNDSLTLLDASGGAVADPYNWRGKASIDTLAGNNILVIGATGASATTLGSAASRPRRAMVATVTGTASADQLFASDLAWLGARTGAVTLPFADSLGDIVVKADTGAATLTDGTAGRDILVAAGTAATLGTGIAGDDIFVLGGTSALVTTARVLGTTDNDTATAALRTEDDSADLISTVTGRRIDRLDGSNILVEAGTTATATTLTAIGALGRDIRVGANGDIAVTTASAARDVVLDAGSNVTLDTAVANRDVTAIGGTVTVTRALAGDDVAVVARTGTATVTTAQALGRTLDLDPLSAGFGTPTATAATGNEAGAATILVGLDLAGVADPSGTGSIANLAGSSIVIAGATGATLTTGTAATDLRLGTATGAASLATGRAGQDLLVLGDSVTVSTLAEAGDDLALVARAGDAIVLPGATIAATGRVFDAVAGTFGAAAGPDSEADDTVALTDLSNAALADPTRPGAVALSRFAGANLLVAASGAATVPAATADRDLRVVAGAAATLTTATAGRDLLLLGTTATSADSLTAGDDATVIATIGDASVGTIIATGAGPDSEADDSIALLDASGIGIANPATGSGAGSIARLAGANIVVAAAGGVTATTARAATDTRLAAAGDTGFTTALAGRDLLVVGGTVTGTTAQAGDDVALVARTGAVTVDTLTTTGLGLDAVTGANLATAAADSEAGNDALALAGLASGSNITDPTKAGAVALTRFAGANALAIGTTTAIVTSASTARDLRVVAGTDAVLTTGAAGRDLLLLGGTATSTGNLTAGDDLTVIATIGAVALDTASLTAGTDSEAGNDALALLDASGTAVADPYGWQGSAVIDTLAGRNIVLAAATGVTATSLGSAALPPRQVRATTADGDATIPTAFATDLIWVGTRTGNALLTTGTSGGDIVVKADAGAATLAIGTAGSDILVLAGGLATLVSGTAGDDIFVLAGGNAVVTTATTLGTADDDTATASLRTEDDSADLVSLVTARRIDRLDGSNIVVEAAGNALVTTATAGNGSGRDIRIGALGTADATTLAAGRDAIVQAGAATTVATIVANRDVTVIGTTADVTRAVAGDDVTVVATTGAATVASAQAFGRTLDLDPLGAGFGTPTATATAGNEVTAATTLFDLALATVAAPGGGAIAGLAGANVTVAGATDATLVTGTAATDLRLAAGTGTAALTTGRAGQDLLLLGRSVTVATLAEAGDDLAVIARGGDATIADGASLVATGAGPDSEADDSVALVDLASAAVLDPAGTLPLAQLAGSNIVVAATGAATVPLATATRDVRVHTGGAATLAAATAGRDLRVVAGSDAVLTTGTAGRDLLLLGTTATSADSLAAGDDATVIATTGDAGVNIVIATGAGPDSEADDTIALLDASGLGIANPATGSGTGNIARLTGANTVVAAAGTVAATTATATADVRLAADNGVTFTTARAGHDLLAIGSTVTGTTAEAGDDAAVIARTGAATVATLTATGLGLDSDSDVATLAGLAAGSSIADPTKAAATPLTRFAGSNAIAIGATTATVTTGRAARDLRVVAATDATLTTGTAGRDLLLLAGRDATTTSLTAGDDATVVAGGKAMVAAVTATGLGPNGETDDTAALLDASGAAITDPTRSSATPLNRLLGSNIVVAARTDALVTTANAARDLRVVAGDTASATLGTGTAGRDLLLLGGSATSTASLVAGDDVTVVARTGAATVASVRATGAGPDSEGNDTATLVDASGAAIANPAAAPAASIASLARSNVVIAATTNTTATTAEAPRDVRLFAGNNATLTTGRTTGEDIVIDAGGIAAATTLAAGRDLKVSSSNITLGTGAAVTAARATLLTVRNPLAGGAVQNAVIGNVTTPPAGTSWTLDGTELAAIRTPQLDIAAGARLVTIGDATPNAATVTRFAVATTDAINIVGVLAMPGTGRELTLGGTTATLDAADNSASPTAALIRVVTSAGIPGATAQPNGQIQAAGAEVRLRANKIAIGQQVDFQVTTPADLTQQQVIDQFFLRPTSNLYIARPTPYSGAAADATYLRAATLSLTVGEWALLQNTATSAQPGGGSAIGTLQLFSGTAGDPTVALFGALNNVTGVAAALQVNQIILNGVAPFNVRINGCVALQGVGCIVSTNVVPDPKLPNPSSAFLLTIAPSLAVPIDLISGGTNEALWRTDECDENSKDELCKQAEIKQ